MLQVSSGWTFTSLSCSKVLFLFKESKMDNDSVIPDIENRSLLVENEFVSRTTRDR